MGTLQDMTIYAEEARSGADRPEEVVTAGVAVGRRTLILLGVATSGFFAAGSLSISTLVARVFLEGGRDSLAVAFVGFFTVIGACVGSWFSQPAVTRLARRLPD
jgi:hypothetical protein